MEPKMEKAMERDNESHAEKWSKRLASKASRKLGGKFAKKAQVRAKGSGPDRPLAGTGLEDEMVFEFDTNEYDFRSCLHEMLDIDRSKQLHLLHTCDEAVAYMQAVQAASSRYVTKKGVSESDVDIDSIPGPGAKDTKSVGNINGRRGNPFLRRWKRIWSGEKEHSKTAAMKRFEALLLRFNREFCAPRMGGQPCMFQREPTLRVVFPSPFATGRPHCDSEYYHQPAEINWWLPISDRVFGGNSLYVESQPGLRDFHALELRYGQVCRFYGNQCVHYCVPNDTDTTRVSIDFRTIPESYYDSTYTHLPDGYVPFSLGSYYRLSSEAQHAPALMQPPAHASVSPTACVSSQAQDADYSQDPPAHI